MSSRFYKGGTVDSDLMEWASEALLQACARKLLEVDPHLTADIEWFLNNGPWRSNEPSNELENILLRLRRGSHVRQEAYTKDEIRQKKLRWAARLSEARQPEPPKKRKVKSQRLAAGRR